MRNLASGKFDEAQRALVFQTWSPFVATLVSAIDKLPAMGEQRVYRGIPDNVSDVYWSGRVVCWSTVTSTTTSPGKAYEYAQGGLPRPAERATVLRITSFSGRWLGNLSYFPEEAEVVLAPNSRFIVTSKTHRGMELYW